MAVSSALALVGWHLTAQEGFREWLQRSMPGSMDGCAI
jgi:hypothetical protein